jgi:hypothetical protein
MTYSKDIRDKSLTMLIPTTGDRWPLLLEYFSDSCQTNGMKFLLTILYYESFFIRLVRKIFILDYWKKKFCS